MEEASRAGASMMYRKDKLLQVVYLDIFSEFVKIKLSDKKTKNVILSF